MKSQFLLYILVVLLSAAYLPHEAKAETMDPKTKTLAELAISHLSEHLKIPKSGVTLISIKPTDWPDTSLGCPQPRMMYAQVITPGFRIVLKVGEKKYVYHTDRESRVVLCENAASHLTLRRP
jgi:hypothetical protein